MQQADRAVAREQITTSTYTLLKDISESPAKVLDKLADTLPKSRYFFVSYVMLAGLAFLPLQLLELGTVIPRVFCQVFLTKTPRGASGPLSHTR